MNRIAAGLAFVVGAMSIVAGGKAMQGWDPGYSVLGWLPVYNFVMGMLTVLLPAILLWKNNRYAARASLAAFFIHVAVTALLLVAFRGVVAQESIAAMLFRLTVWLIILGLVFFQSGKDKKLTTFKNI